VILMAPWFFIVISLMLALAVGYYGLTMRH
jgi:hypothetical protein